MHNYVIVLLGRLCDIHGTQRLVKSYILPCIIFLINLWYNFSLVLQAFLCRLCRLDFVATFYKYFRSGQSHLKSRNNMLESPSNFVIFDLLKKHVNCKHTSLKIKILFVPVNWSLWPWSRPSSYFLWRS